MRYVIPLKVQNLNTSIQKNDYPAYDNEKTYKLGECVSVKEDNKNYKCAKENAVGLNPKDNPRIWISEPMNFYAMFDGFNSKITTDNKDISFNFIASDDGDTFSFFDLCAKQIIININGVEVSQNTFIVDVKSFYDYLFAKSKFIKQTDVKFKFFRGDKISITLIDFDNKASCKYFAYGKAQDLGLSLYDGNISIKSFSKITRDDFGNANLIKRDSFIIFDIPVIIDELELSNITQIFKEIDATPCVFIGDESNTHEVLRVFGVYQNFQAPINPRKIIYNLKIEGIQ